MDDPSLPAVVAQNTLKRYLPDPYERARDLKHKLKQMRLPFGMTALARVVPTPNKTAILR